MKNQNDEFVQTQEIALTQEEQIFKNLVEQNSSLYKAPSGEIYQVYLEEAGTSSHSYQEIHSNYGRNNKYDADVDYQRLKDQHPLETKKKILLDYTGEAITNYLKQIDKTLEANIFGK
jgi:hypothetical protein